MAGVQSRDFSSPDETRTPEKPGAGTDSCQARHVGVVSSGRLAVRHDDGTDLELNTGDAYIIEPGHDAWVVGDERFVAFEFESRSAEEYAKS